MFGNAVPGVPVGSELLGWEFCLWEGIQTEFLNCGSWGRSVSTAGGSKDREGQALPFLCPVEGQPGWELLPWFLTIKLLFIPNGFSAQDRKIGFL